MARTYVVTGSASGVGAATKERLESQGVRVIGIDLHDAEVTADLTVPEQRSRAAREAIALADGAIDAVIAAAGIAAPVPATVAVNYFGVTELLEALRPTLASSPAPRAVVVSSMATLQPTAPRLVEACLAADEPLALEIGAELAAEGPQIGFFNYSGSKRALSRWVRRESITSGWAGAGIPLNAVAPGTILTPMTDELLASDESRAMVDASVPMPLNYHQEAIVVADLLIWLASEENSHCAGQTIYCDGGADVTMRGDDIWGWNDAPVS